MLLHLITNTVQDALVKVIGLSVDSSEAYTKAENTDRNLQILEKRIKENRNKPVQKNEGYK